MMIIIILIRVVLIAAIVIVIVIVIAVIPFFPPAPLSRMSPSAARLAARPAADTRRRAISTDDYVRLSDTRHLDKHIDDERYQLIMNITERINAYRHDNY